MQSRNLRQKGYTAPRIAQLMRETRQRQTLQDLRLALKLDRKENNYPQPFSLA